MKWLLYTAPTTTTRNLTSKKYIEPVDFKGIVCVHTQNEREIAAAGNFYSYPFLR
jgi:hypothetical protein